MNYRMRPGLGDVTNPDFTQWDKTDWTIAGLVGFALWMGWSARFQVNAGNAGPRDFGRRLTS
jgi:hypothetical protein